MSGKRPIKFTEIWKYFKTTPSYYLSKNAALFPLRFTQHMFNKGLNMFKPASSSKTLSDEEIQKAFAEYQSHSFIEKFERKVFNTYWQDPEGKMVKIGTNKYANPEYLSSLVSTKSNRGGLRYKGFIVNNYENVAFERSPYSTHAYVLWIVSISYFLYCWFLLDAKTDNEGLAYYTVRDLLTTKNGYEFEPNKKNIATLLNFKPDDIPSEKLAEFQFKNRQLDNYSAALIRASQQLEQQNRNK